jgi:hypothetical protein
MAKKAKGRKQAPVNEPGRKPVPKRAKKKPG